jgi:VWFA-related protein
MTRLRMLITGTLLTLVAALAILAQVPEGPQGSQPGVQQGQKPGQQPPPKPAPDPQQGGATIAVEVPVVTLDVIATTDHGDILTNLKKENFKITDNGVPQTITNFGPTEAPITCVMLIEFSGRFYGFFSYYAKYWSEAFFPYLQQKDWIALETFDMKTRVEVDFTQNKDEVRSAIYHLYFPGFSESNVFDAILETSERLKDVKGKKSILLLASGVDTFSKHTLDQTMKQLRQSDVTIFSIGLGKVFTNYLETHGSLGAHMDYLQAENQLRTFSQLTGGYSWFPQFDGEIPGIMQSVAAFLRHQYSISYSPSAGANDGKFHKVKVELVAPDGGPLVVLNQKGKKQKYQVYAREGYTAIKGGVGD